jgi:hypothetical protein
MAHFLEIPERLLGATLGAGQLTQGAERNQIVGVQL